jgi:hypothetical protein
MGESRESAFPRISAVRIISEACKGPSIIVEPFVVDRPATSEREQTIRAAKKRHKVNSAELAANRCLDQVGDLQHQIAETPAEGLIGIAIKLAVCVQERDFMQEPAAAVSWLPLTGLPRVSPAWQLHDRHLRQGG